jgi:uncharacterized protein
MIFADSGAFIGLYLTSDSFHADASAIWGQIESRGERLMTTNHVLDEVLTILARRAGYRFAADRAERIYASRAFEIWCSTLEDERDAISFFRKYADQRVSFTDCISFVVMRRHGVGIAFTFDRHFTQAGFRTIGIR